MSSSLVHVIKTSCFCQVDLPQQVPFKSTLLMGNNSYDIQWSEPIKQLLFHKAPPLLSNNCVVESVFTTCAMKLYVVSLKAAFKSLVLTSCLWEMISVVPALTSASLWQQTGMGRKTHWRAAHWPCSSTQMEQGKMFVLQLTTFIWCYYIQLGEKCFYSFTLI